MKRSIYFIYSGLLLLLVLFASPVWAQEPEPQWYPPHHYPTRTPTATATATPTATATRPTLQACQVTQIRFLEDFYSDVERPSYDTGETIRVRVSVADQVGAPLVGANVDAEVIRQALTAQATTPVDLEDRSGDYDGVYTQTGLPGIYQFQFTVSDPTGQRFAPCNGSAVILVEEGPTPPPTVEPPVTVTPPAGSTTVRVLPEQLQTTLCSLRETTAIRVENVTDLAVVQMEVSYDPAVIQVIDADVGQPGVQVRVNSAFSTDTIFDNIVDTRNGRITFGAGVIGVPAINGSSGLIAIDWRPQQVGLSAVTIEQITLLDVNGQPINAAVTDGSVEVQFVTNCLQGAIVLQGRTDHSGVTVTNGAGDQTTTLPDGSFAIPASESLSFDHAGYLAAAANVQQALASAQADQPIVLAAITMPAGDLNGDNVINIFDLAFLAQHFLTTEPAADLNGDGTVDIKDLALVANNYLQQGPVVSSR